MAHGDELGRRNLSGCALARAKAMSRAARARKDIVEILQRWQRRELPPAETCEAIDARIETEINEAVQDALREIRPDE
jgi:hypothetical protein